MQSMMIHWAAEGKPESTRARVICNRPGQHQQRLRATWRRCMHADGEMEEADALWAAVPRRTETPMRVIMAVHATLLHRSTHPTIFGN